MDPTPSEWGLSRAKAWWPALADGPSSRAAHVDLFVLAVLLALFCLRVWDLGIVHSDDAAWALRAWQGRWGIIWDWAIGQGRVWALVSGPLLFTALKVKGSLLGNLAIAGGFAVFFALFHWVIAVHFGRRIAVLTACTNLGLYAMRWEGSLITAYPFFTWALGSLYLLSLLALERYFASGSRGLLATSLILFFCSLFLHEGVTVLFELLYALAALHHSRRAIDGGSARQPTLRKATRTALVGWLAVVASYALLYFGWRLVFPSVYRGNALAEFNAVRIARVALAFALNGSLLHDMFSTYTVRFSDPAFFDLREIGYPFWAFVRHPHLGPGSLAAGALSSWLVWHALGRLRPAGRVTGARMQLAFAVIAGVLIAFVPIVPVAATPKYQHWYYDLGVRAYVHTALSHFGTSLVVAAILIWMVDSLRRRYAWLAMVVGMSCLFAVLSTTGYVINDAIARDMRAEASRWLVFGRAIGIMRTQGWSGYNIVAPRFASGSWFAVLPPSYWVEWAAARYGMQIGFMTTAVPARDLTRDSILLDFIQVGATGTFMTLAHMRSADAHSRPVADTILVASVTAADYRVTEQVVHFDDVKLGPREVRLLGAERMPQDPSVRVIRAVAADPASIRVLPQSSVLSLPIACATPLLPTDRVTFGTSTGPGQPACIGTAFLGEGWHAPEQTGVWSRSGSATLRLPIENSGRDLRVRLTLRSYPGLGFYDATTNLQVRAGSRLVAERRDAFRSSMPPIEFVIAPEDKSADGTVALSIGVDKTYNPRRLEVAQDDRDLGVHLETMEILPIRDKGQ